MTSPKAQSLTNRLLSQIAVMQAVDEGVIAAVCPSRQRLAIYTTAAELREALAKPMSEVIAPSASIIAHHPGAAL